MLIAGCGDDDDSTTATTEGSTTSEAESADDSVQVTLADYKFEDLPESVDAGTTFTVRNDSEAELHELVAFRLPDDEKRSVEDLVQLPEAELGALFAGEPATVLLAEPGSDKTIPAVGTGAIDEAGRYAVMCFIPQGADPRNTWTRQQRPRVARRRSKEARLTLCWACGANSSSSRPRLSRSRGPWRVVAVSPDGA